MPNATVPNDPDSLENLSDDLGKLTEKMAGINDLIRMRPSPELFDKGLELTMQIAKQKDLVQRASGLRKVLLSG